MTANRWTIQGEGTIHIVRDSHGVPHIRAGSEADLYRGLGYCHGTDRALQVLLQRVVVSGRTAELLRDSAETRALDRTFRRLGFAADAEAEADRLSAADRALADAYCAGIDAALAVSLPFELRLARYRPAPWTVADAIMLSRAIAWIGLAQTQGELERFVVELVKAGVSRDRLEALFPGQLEDLDAYLLRKVRLGERIVPPGVLWASALATAVGSNNWVISGRHTASGAAMLANDPHLEVNRLPAVWYEAVLEASNDDDCMDDYCIAATMPGLPAMIIGRNASLAWGVTYAFMDGVDSWVEDCRDGCYRRNEGGEEKWLAFRERRETIRYKGGGSEELICWENDHGLVDGDPHVAGLLLTTRWTAARGTGAASLGAFFDLRRAKNVREGAAAAARVETAWNWVFADTDDHIAYQMSGLMPIRRKPNQGLVPLPGWDPANDWQGFVDPGDLPRALDPSEGFLVTANNDLNHLGRAKPINAPMASYRAERIADLISQRSDWSLSATERMQTDVLSNQARAFMDILRPMLPRSLQGDRLRDWDCRYDLQSESPVLFEAFYRGLFDEVFGGVLGAQVAQHLRDETAILVEFYGFFDRVLLDPRSVWYGDEGRDAVFERVARKALRTTAMRPWGETRHITMTHLLFSGRAAEFFGFSEGPVPLAGGRATIRQGQILRSGGRDTTIAPSFRLIVDFAERGAHTALAGGPSDRRLSRLYRSDIDRWLRGVTKAIEPSPPGTTAT